jgi:hypothetical protein
VKDIRGRKRAEFTDDDYQYFARLREELAKGPKGMCDLLEYAPLDETEQAVEMLKGQYERGIVHGSDIRAVEPATETNRQSLRKPSDGLRLDARMGGRYT